MLGWVALFFGVIVHIFVTWVACDTIKKEYDRSQRFKLVIRTAVPTLATIGGYSYLIFGSEHFVFRYFVVGGILALSSLLWFRFAERTSKQFGSMPLLQAARDARYKGIPDVLIHLSLITCFWPLAPVTRFMAIEMSG